MNRDRNEIFKFDYFDVDRKEPYEFTTYIFTDKKIPLKTI